jgi:hypothetical protein
MWQMFLHTSLLNLKLPGFIDVSWRSQLSVWTLRNKDVNNLMHQLSGIPEIERKSYTLQLELAGFNSTQVYVNLGLLLWIPAILIALMPFAWVVDSVCTVKDDKNAQFGGRKPLTKKPLLQTLTNILTRFALMFILDLMVCVFITFANDGDIAVENHATNLGICYVVIALLSSLLLIEIGHGVWRYFKSRKAETWSDF